MKALFRFLLCLVFAVPGCALPDPERSKPVPVADTLDGAAVTAAREYFGGMADLCEATATDLEAGKFKAQAQVVDQFKAASTKLRQDAFSKLGTKFDAVIPPGTDLSPAETAEAYRLMGQGFRRSVK